MRHPVNGRRLANTRHGEMQRLRFRSMTQKRPTRRGATRTAGSSSALRSVSPVRRARTVRQGSHLDRATL